MWTPHLCTCVSGAGFHGLGCGNSLGKKQKNAEEFLKMRGQNTSFFHSLLNYTSKREFISPSAYRIVTNYMVTIINTWLRLIGMNDDSQTLGLERGNEQLPHMLPVHTA